MGIFSVNWDTEITLQYGMFKNGSLSIVVVAQPSEICLTLIIWSYSSESVSFAICITKYHILPGPRSIQSFDWFLIWWYFVWLFFQATVVPVCMRSLMISWSWYVPAVVTYGGRLKAGVSLQFLVSLFLLLLQIKKLSGQQLVTAFNMQESDNTHNTTNC